MILLAANIIYPQINTDSLALKLLGLTNSKMLYESSMSIMLIEHNASYGKKPEILTNFMWKYFSYDSIKYEYAKLYSEEFTKDELQELINFYTSGLGQRMVNKAPMLFAKTLRIANDRFQKKIPILDSLLYSDF